MARHMLYKLVCLVALVVSAPLWAGQQPVIAIIIDDIGYSAYQDRQALALPGPVAYAILPHTPGVRAALELAQDKNKEVMLHMPMETSRGPDKAAPGTLTRHMDWLRFVRTVQKNMAAVPGIVAVNNHEGSVLTTDRQRMQWLMEELKRHGGTAFIDSRTTHHTVALDTARQYGLKATRRDVFLDYAPGKIDEQFRELVSLAKRQGSALAIAHPRPETLKYLQARLGDLSLDGVQHVAVSELLQRRNPGITSSLHRGERHVAGTGSAR